MARRRRLMFILIVSCSNRCRPTNCQARPRTMSWIKIEKTNDANTLRTSQVGINVPSQVFLMCPFNSIGQNKSNIFLAVLVIAFGNLAQGLANVQCVCSHIGQHGVTTMKSLLEKKKPDAHSISSYPQNMMQSSFAVHDGVAFRDGRTIFVYAYAWKTFKTSFLQNSPSKRGIKELKKAYLQ